MSHRRNVNHIKNTSQRIKQPKSFLRACVSKTLLGFTSMRACSCKISYPYGLKGRQKSRVEYIWLKLIYYQLIILYYYLFSLLPSQSKWAAIRLVMISFVYCLCFRILQLIEGIQVFFNRLISKKKKCRPEKGICHPTSPCLQSPNRLSSGSLKIDIIYHYMIDILAVGQKLLYIKKKLTSRSTKNTPCWAVIQSISLSMPDRVGRSRVLEMYFS